MPAIAVIVALVALFGATYAVAAGQSQPTSTAIVTVLPTPPSGEGSRVSIDVSKAGSQLATLGGFPFAQAETQRNATPMVSSGGELRHGAPTTTNAVSYLQLQNQPTPVTRIGATMTFSDTRSGSVALVAWQQSLVNSIRAGRLVGSSIPNAGIHFAADISGWHLGVWDGAASREVVILRGNYGATAGVPVSYQVDRAGSTATITDPDGVKSSITDPRIGEWTGQWATWELYENNAQQTPATLSKLWVS